MNQEQIDQLKDLIDYERKRKSPPKDFPKLPDLPGKRYTDKEFFDLEKEYFCLLYTSPSPRDQRGSRMPSSA